MKHVVLLFLFILSFNLINSALASFSDVKYEYFVNAKYIKTITVSKSAKKSQDSCKISSIIFERDSVVVCLNVHEYYKLKLFRKNAKSFFCFMNENDTINLNYINNNLKVSSQFGQETFVKFITDEITKNSEKEVLKKMIFKGAYIDAVSGQSVIFKEDGSVNGILNFKAYDVQSDYYDEGCNLDILRLGKDESSYESFTWEYDKEILILYRLECAEMDSISNDCGITKKGVIVCKLKMN